MSDIEKQRSLFTFGQGLDTFASKLGIQFDTALRRLALEVYNGITVKTPVDTGRARASWNLTRGKIDLSVLPDTKGIKLGTATIAGKNADQIANMKGSTLIASGPLGRAFLVEPIYITNNLPYIIYLENGSSEQAPHGMVATTLDEVQARLSAAINKL